MLTFSTFVLGAMLYAGLVLLAIPARAQITEFPPCDSGWMLINTSDDCYIAGGKVCSYHCDNYYCASSGSTYSDCHKVCPFSPNYC